MSKTRFVAFATQKGGIGKSTITALVANYFHNVKGYNVAVMFRNLVLVSYLYAQYA